MNDDPSPRPNPTRPIVAVPETTVPAAGVAQEADTKAEPTNGAAGPATPPPPPPSKRAAVRRSFWREIWRLIRRPRAGLEASLRDTLEELAERHESDGGPIDPTERLILENTLRLRSRSVEDVMVPRIDITAVDIETPVVEVIQRIGETYHSRLPVFEGDLDHIVGLVHVKDVLPHAAVANPPPLRSLLRPVMIVAPSMRILDLMLRMQLERNHMALVVDEFGGIDGLVTIEDLVEQIVGDIEDEHEIAEDAQLEMRPDGSLIADARVLVEDFEEEVGAVLTDEERDHIDTLGGLVFTLVGRVPSRGEIVVHPSGIEFEILEGDPRRLKRLRIRNLPLHPQAADAVA